MISSARSPSSSDDLRWDKILTRLKADADAADELVWTVSVDLTVVRVHQQGATAVRPVTAPATGT
jgi:hypothetical protein